MYGDAVPRLDAADLEVISQPLDFLGVNIYEGQELRVALQMSDDGYARWKDTGDFLNSIDASRKLTDAEVKRIEGIATYFSNSHYRVDTKENFKNDTTIVK